MSYIKTTITLGYIDYMHVEHSWHNIENRSCSVKPGVGFEI